jgi:hypothetical protein
LYPNIFVGLSITHTHVAPWSEVRRRYPEKVYENYSELSQTTVIIEFICCIFGQIKSAGSDRAFFRTILGSFTSPSCDAVLDEDTQVNSDARRDFDFVAVFGFSATVRAFPEANAPARARNSCDNLCAGL